MVCSMVKKGLLGAALGAGALFLVFGTSAPSYVKTAFHKVRQNVKESVDPAVRHRPGAAGDRQPEADVRSEQGDAGPRRGRGRKPRARSRHDPGQPGRAKRRRSCRCRTGSRRVTSAWPAMSPTPRTRSRPSWPIGWTTTITRPTLLKQKQEILKAKRKIIQAAHEQLETLRTQKSTLLAKLANIEAKLRDHRGDPVQERVQLRRQCPVPCQADGLRSGGAARRHGHARPRSKVATAIWTARRPMSIPTATWSRKSMRSSVSPARSPAGKTGDKSL